MLAKVVEVQALRVAVAGDIQPVMRAVLAITGTCQQPVDDFLVCIRGLVRHKRLHVFRSGRQTREIVGDAANQRRPIRLFRRLQPFLLQPAQNESINRRSWSTADCC